MRLSFRYLRSVRLKIVGEVSLVSLPHVTLRSYGSQLLRHGASSNTAHMLGQREEDALQKELSAT